MDLKRIFCQVLGYAQLKLALTRLPQISLFPRPSKKLSTHHFWVVLNARLARHIKTTPQAWFLCAPWPERSGGSIVASGGPVKGGGGAGWINGGGGSRGGCEGIRTP